MNIYEYASTQIVDHVCVFKRKPIKFKQIAIHV